MPEQSTTNGPPHVDVIHLFQRNLERETTGEEQLAEQIRITVLHETAHFFGYEDDRLEELGLG
jgi:predicted Zn-dependent protease with MMP-like domain